MAIDPTPSDTVPAPTIFIDHEESPFKAVPRSSVEARAENPVVDESSVITQVLIEVFNWFFSNGGKHRKMMLKQYPFANGYATNPDGKNTKQQQLTIQALGTYQYRNNPSIVIEVGSQQSQKTGLGIAVEGSNVASKMQCLQKRSYNIYDVKIRAESNSNQTTNKLSKMLGDIFNLHIPELYQSVVLNDFSQSQIIFPQEYSQPEFLTKDFQHEANVERVWTWEVSFKIEFEAIRFIKGFDTPIIVNKEGERFLSIDLPSTLKIGKTYIITVKTNLYGVKIYSTNPAIFSLQQMSGPFGEGNGDRTYRGQALRIGSFKLYMQDMSLKNRAESLHTVGWTEFNTNPTNFAAALAASIITVAYGATIDLTPTFSGGVGQIGSKGVRSYDILDCATSGQSITTEPITARTTYTLTVYNTIGNFISSDITINLVNGAE